MWLGTSLEGCLGKFADQGETTLEIRVVGDVNRRLRGSCSNADIPSAA